MSAAAANGGIPPGPVRVFLRSVSTSVLTIAGPTTPPRPSRAWQLTHPFVT